MSNKYIIECRNKESENKVANGDWTTNLQESLLLENGDQVMIKSSFVDTQQTSSSKILIPDDITISVDYSFYILNNLQQQWIYIDGTVADDPTFDNFILVKNISNIPAQMRLVGEYFLTTVDPNGSSSATDLDFYWDNIDGDQENIKINIPSLNPNQKFKVKELTGKLVDTSVSVLQNLNDFGLKVLGAVYVDPTGKDLLQPYELTKSVQIKKGNYDPDQLVSIINSEFTKNQLDGTAFTIGDNQFIQSARQIQSRFHEAGTNTAEFFLTRAVGGSSDYVYLFDVMDTYPNIHGSSEDVVLGSSQFEIGYSSDTKTFSFDYLHMPFYENSNIAVQYKEDPNFPGTIYSINKTGGIYFNRLYAKKDKDNSTFDFWEAILGFNTDTLIPQIDYIDVNFTFKGTNKNYLYPQTVDLTDGVTITGQTSSIANVVDISNPAILELPPFSRGVDSNDTISIIAPTSSLDTQFSFGYYIIEVNSQFKNDFLTESNNYRNIQQIVSRYYELNSYTNGNSDGSIIYTHSGEPVLLQSFKCRILDSDKVLASNIGEDNTVHIEIIKNNK